MKKWYDDWKITKNIQASGVITVDLPNSAGKEKSITIKGKYSRKHIDYLIDALMSALSNLTSRKEICICAAIRINDVTIIRGHRHDDCLYAALKRGWTEKALTTAEQGFITSDNRFVGREEGLQLQLAAHVPSSSKYGYDPVMLFSEDLY